MIINIFLPTGLSDPASIPPVNLTIFAGVKRNILANIFLVSKKDLDWLVLCVWTFPYLSRNNSLL